MKTLAQEGDLAEIRRRLRAMPPDSPRRWGRMTAHQMICHLSDSFLAVLGRRPASTATGPMQRTLLKWTALYLPLPWPQGVRTRPEIDQTIGGTPPADFATDVAQLEALLALVVADARCFEGQQHPIFGPMTRSAWLRWGYLHMDHHLRQFGA
jgi:hypothetical protein